MLIITVLLSLLYKQTQITMRKTRKVAAFIDSNIIELFDEIAVKHGISRAELIRRSMYNMIETCERFDNLLKPRKWN